MICPGETVLVALSGGADSVCLFRVLYALSESYPFRLEAVHVNHMLRDTAGRDEAFARALCERFGVPFHCEKVDVAAYAKEQRLGTEEAARTLRYEVFERIREQIGAGKVALAHHEGDQAETILFHLCRGCGIEGLRGMEPVSDYYIRPLLGCDRAAIEKYLACLSQSYVTDETNLENIYSRNILRNLIMPVLTENICAKTQAHIAATGERMGQLEDFIHMAVEQAYRDCVQDAYQRDADGKKADRKQSLDIPALQRLHPFVRSELVRTCLYRLCETKKDITDAHVAAVCGLCDKQTGRSISLPYHMRAYRSYHAILLEKFTEADEKEDGDAQLWQQEILIGAQGAGFACEYAMQDGRKLSVSIFSRPKDANIPTKAYTKWLDYAKLDKSLALRMPKEGDYFLMADGHKKYLKDYMKNEKIPAGQRAFLPIVAMGNHVVYIVGRRISEACKVTETTEMIVQIHVRD